MIVLHHGKKAHGKLAGLRGFVARHKHRIGGARDFTLGALGAHNSIRTARTAAGHGLFGAMQGRRGAGYAARAGVVYLGALGTARGSGILMASGLHDMMRKVGTPGLIRTDLYQQKKRKK